VQEDGMPVRVGDANVESTEEHEFESKTAKWTRPPVASQAKSRLLTTVRVSRTALAKVFDDASFRDLSRRFSSLYDPLSIAVWGLFGSASIVFLIALRALALAVP
jgi:hypothetical protein